MVRYAFFNWVFPNKRLFTLFSSAPWFKSLLIRKFSKTNNILFPGLLSGLGQAPASGDLVVINNKRDNNIEECFDLVVCFINGFIEFIIPPVGAEIKQQKLVWSVVQSTC